MQGKANSLRILLVYPRYPDTFWSFRYALKFISKKGFSPPLGLLTVAALLPKTWERRMVDLNVSELKDEDIRWADYVFLSAMEAQQQSVKENITRIKSFEKKIVAGGPLFTMSPDQFGRIDHLVLREAEEIIPSLADDLETGKGKRIYEPSGWPDLTSSPIPQWSLLDFSKYAVMNVQYGRGCPFDCEFCHVGFLNGRTPRAKAGGRVIQELEALYHEGWRGVVFFVDDNFAGNALQLKKDLLPALIKWMGKKRYPFSFITQASLNIADDEELMNLMVRAGFDSVFVGVESTEEQSLRESNKTLNVRRNLMRSVKKMQTFGLQVLGGFIVGFDHDPPQVFQNQTDFIQESGICTAMVGLLSPLRGTKLYERLRQEGRLLADTTGNNTDYSISFIPRMGHQALLEGYKWMVDKIYSPCYFYQRLVTFLSNYKRPSKIGGRIQLSDVKALFNSFWILGILGEGRFYYWRTLFWTILRRPLLFPLFIRLAIYGFHFRKVFQIQVSKQGA